MSYQKALTPDTVNPIIKRVEYAVRGKLVLKALELEKQMADAKAKGEKNPLKLRSLNETIFNDVS